MDLFQNSEKAHVNHNITIKQINNKKKRHDWDWTPKNFSQNWEEEWKKYGKMKNKNLQLECNIIKLTMLTILKPSINREKQNTWFYLYYTIQCLCILIIRKKKDIYV